MLATCFAIVFGIFFFVFNTSLPKIYLDYNDPAKFADNYEVWSMASKLLLIAAVFQISDTMQVVVLGALRGMQDVKIPTLITFIGYWLIGFPISYYLSMFTEYGISGIWIGLLAGLTSCAIMLLMRFTYLSRRLIVKNETASPIE